MISKDYITQHTNDAEKKLSVALGIIERSGDDMSKESESTVNTLVNTLLGVQRHLNSALLEISTNRETPWDY